LIRKLETIVDLTGEERNAIASLPFIARDMKAGQDIVRDHDRPSQCCLIVEGYAFRYKILDEGQRQILSFHIAGDIPDLQSLHLKVMDHSLATVCRSRVAFLPHELLRPFLHRHPRLADILWRDTLVDAAIFREWVVNIGRRHAYPRLAHLFCEMFVRVKAMGQADADIFQMPFTQEHLADATGLSAVHVNRTMTLLRDNGLISTPRGSIIVEDWDALKELAGFDPTYLHLQEAAQQKAEVLGARP
jgi:CRP-like cAMP-binding protein